MFVFDRESEDNAQLESIVIRQLNYELKYDWYKTYAIKCRYEGKITSDILNNCRKWLKFEIKAVKPYLIVLFGKASIYAVLGTKYKRLRVGVMYNGNHRYFIADSLSAGEESAMNSVQKILSFIREFYQ